MNVCAVIVTHDRPEMLKRCLCALRGQTRRPDRIIVVDNASELAMPDLTGCDYRRLRRNYGGAGGFFFGMNAAIKNGAEWIWMMDDDGHAEPDTLRILLERAQSQKLDLCGPLVLAENDATILAFGLAGRRKLHEVTALRRDGLIWGEINPFNGTLVHVGLARRIGLVQPRFFLWGDEIEYLYRAKRAGARVATVVDARFHHPAKDGAWVPVWGGWLGNMSIKPDRLAAIYFRNLGFLDRRLGCMRSRLRNYAQHGAWFLCRSRPDVAALARFIRCYRRGWSCSWPEPRLTAL